MCKLKINHYILLTYSLTQFYFSYLIRKETSKQECIGVSHNRLGALESIHFHKEEHCGNDQSCFKAKHKDSKHKCDSSKNYNS